METTITDRKIDMYLALNAKMDLKIVFLVVRRARVIKVCDVEDSQLKNYQPGLSKVGKKLTDAKKEDLIRVSPEKITSEIIKYIF